ncbi:MAG TPA: hypothetical protein DD426_01240, partial [Clostridiaceae bacterium]|nr:hypothetical protein [Clostridiaceae bacterium]
MKYYHVTTCADENKAWVTKRLQYYKSLGYNSIIKNMSINVKDLPEALKNDQKCALFYSLLKVTGDSISINQDALRDYESKKTDDRILKSKLYASYSNIAKIYNEYKKSSTSLDFKEIDKKVNDQISLFSEISKNGGVVDKINIDEKMMQIIYYYRDIADKANSLI